MAKKVKKDVDVIAAVDDTNIATVDDAKCDVNPVGKETPVAKSDGGMDVKSTKVMDVAFGELEMKYRDIKSRYDSAMQAMAGLNADNERLCDELSTALNENKSLHKDLTKLRQDFKRVQGDNRANSALVETLNEQLATSVSTCESLNEQVKQLNEEIENRKYEMSRLNTFLSMREKEIDNKNAEIADYKEKLSMSFWQRFKFLFFGNRMFK